MYLALLAFCSLTDWAEESVLPMQFSVDRYAAMRAHSPFAIATGTPPPTAPQPSFAANWFVSGIARIGDDDYVTVKARDQSSQFSLFGHEPNPQNQVVMVSIDWVDGIGKSSVTVRKGAETAKLEFNEAVVHGPPQGARAQVAPANNPNGQARTPVPIAGARPAPASQPMQNPRSIPIAAPGQQSVRNRVLPQPPTINRRALVPPRSGSN